MPGVVAEDVASLRKVERDTGRTEWVFAERAANAPPLARMSKPVRAKQLEATVGGADPEEYWWWITDEALEDMARQLETSHYCVVDGMLGDKGAAALYEEVRAARQDGKLESSRLAGGRTGALLSYSHAAVRGDLVGWFDGTEEGLWKNGQLARYLTKVDTLIAQLGEHLGALRGIVNRSKAMVACYPGGGARYVRHCDNSCHAGEGERCNGRRLTVIMYLNPEWVSLHGGELRLFEPFAPKHRPPLCDVQPLLDRLVVFYADYRVPHEVLPAHAERYAITLWYFDADERARAKRQDESGAEADATESEAIQEEIARFERRFGPASEVKTRAISGAAQ